MASLLFVSFLNETGAYRALPEEITGRAHVFEQEHVFVLQTSTPLVRLVVCKIYVNTLLDIVCPVDQRCVNALPVHTPPWPQISWTASESSRQPGVNWKESVGGGAAKVGSSTILPRMGETEKLQGKARNTIGEGWQKVSLWLSAMIWKNLLDMLINNEEGSIRRW